MLTQYDEMGAEEESGEEVKSREGNAEGRSLGEVGEEEMGPGDEEEDDARENDALKKRISTHPLYNKLVEIHLDCLKVSGVVNLDAAFHITPQQHQSEPDQNFPNRFSDLDQFMEAYCLVLSKLREAMEEPQQETVTFIDNMHSQLQEIIAIHPEEPPQPSPSPLSEISRGRKLLTRGEVLLSKAGALLFQIVDCSFSNPIAGTDGDVMRRDFHPFSILYV